MKNINICFNNKDNSFLFGDKNNFNKEKNNDNCNQSINILRMKKSHENNNKDNINKESSFIDENINNKSKIDLLNYGINNNNDNIKKIIFTNNKKAKNNEILNPESEKKYIKFNFFYYYCFSKIINTKKTKDLIHLFNYAISFYKQKLDVVYIFHIIFLIEKEFRIKRTNIDQETFYEL